MKILIVLIFSSRGGWGIVRSLSKGNWNLTVTVVGRIIIFHSTDLILASAGGAQGGPGQTLQLQHSGRQLEGPGRWQAERSHSSLPDLHSTQEHGEGSFNCNCVSKISIKENILRGCSGVHQYYIVDLILFRRVFTNITANRWGSILVILMWPPTMWPDSSRIPNTRFR